MPFRAYTKGWCYWKTYPNLRRQIGLIWWKSIWKRGFNAFSGLHEGLVLLKDLPKPSTPNRTYMVKIYLKTGFQCLFGLTRRVGAIERLTETFDAKYDLYGENLFENGVSMPFRAYTKGWCYWKTYPNLRRQIGLIWWKSIWKRGFNAFSGLHEGLVLLKDLPKPSTPNRTYMVKIYLKTGFQCLFGLTRRVGAIERLIQTFDAK
jgi:hypothetical protein